MSLIIKEPKIPVDFPPANYLRAYQVRDGDNWWTLQKLFGLRDPWSLIRYNFRTDDPAEVNWYLQEYVGCVLKTADGKNYRFSTAAKPGLLYLPRHNFKRGIGGSRIGVGTCDDGPEQVPAKDKTATNTVRWALNLPAVSSLQFNLCGQKVWPDDYHRVRRLIGEGEIVVAHNSSLDESAAYSPETDSIYLGTKANLSEDAVSVVIHEATHAAFDAASVKVDDVTSEMVAYVAQMLFIMTRNKQAEAPILSLPDEAAIFLPAWRLAKRIECTQKRVPDPYYDKTVDGDLMELRNALMAHRIYVKQFACADTYYSGEAGYNGVKGWIYSWKEE